MASGIFRNSTYLVLSQSLVKVVAFFYTIFLARNLGVENFGLLNVALIYFSVISSFADFGISRYLIREIAKEKSNMPKYLFSAGLLRLATGAAFFGIFAVFLYLLDPQKIRVALSLIAMMSIFPQMLAITLDNVFIALQRLSFSALGMLVLNLTTAFLGWVFIRSGFGVMGAAGAVFLGQAVYLLVLLIIIVKQKIIIFGPVSDQKIKTIFKDSLPYGILALIGFISFRIDSLILAYYRGNFEIGIYGAAYKFLETTSFIPVALSTSIFPVVANLYGTNPGKIKSIFKKSAVVMLILGLGLMVSYWVILPPIIRIYLPDYVKSINAIWVLSMSIPLIFIHIPAGQIIISTDKYLKSALIMYFAIMFTNLALAFWFIPIFGFMGAAWITVIGEVITLVTFLIFLKKRVFKS